MQWYIYIKNHPLPLPSLGLQEGDKLLCYVGDSWTMCKLPTDFSPNN